MASKPIPAVGMTAMRLLTTAHQEKVAALTAQYEQDVRQIGDEILVAMGADPHDPGLLVNLDEGVVTGFTDPDVEHLIRDTIATLRAQRDAEGCPPEGTVVDESAVANGATP